MIFTSYYGNIRNLIYVKNFKYDDLIGISRYDYKGENIKTEKMLAPSLSLLWLYKCNLISWKEYCYKFYDEMYKLDYRFWNDFEKNFDGKVLLCYEQNYKNCHRYLVGKFFKYWTGKDLFKEI